jgi:hypothetical protein
MKATPLGNNRYELSSGQIMSNVHGANQCRGEHCGIHRPSNHHMLDWVQAWHFDRMVRVCEHDIGHTDPDSFMGDCAFDCDGCCVPATPDQMLVELLSMKDDLTS